MMRGRLVSLVIHIAIVALLFVSSRPAGKRGKESTARLVRSHVLLVSRLAMHGGGGGGEHSPLPPSRGRLPRPAHQQFVPPTAREVDLRPKLVIEPTSVAALNAQMPVINLVQFGDPFSKDGPPSSGPGSNGGIGGGLHGGVGDHDGPGFGPDDGGGISGTGPKEYSSTPALLYKVEPEFSEEARKAKYQGTVVLTIEVGEDGKARRFHVLRGLGLGLDEKAIEAVTQWRFRPAVRSGKPVPAPATVEVNFRLL